MFSPQYPDGAVSSAPIGFEPTQPVPLPTGPASGLTELPKPIPEPNSAPGPNITPKLNPVPGPLPLPPALPPARPEPVGGSIQPPGVGFQPMGLSRSMATLDATNIPALTDILAAVSGTVDTREAAPVSESIEQLALRSSQKATDSMKGVSQKLESFTSESQQQAEDQQRRLLEQYSLEHERFMMRQNTDVAPLIHN
uniref:Uncharacterized protein n=1 Tax=Lygus hesperus TaxID=30085 RepID=A0A0A9YH27_LYGHE